MTPKHLTPVLVALLLGMGGGGWTAPRDFEALVKSARTARESGRPQEAEKLYREALARRPGWVEGHSALGILLYESQRYVEA